MSKEKSAKFRIGFQFNIVSNKSKEVIYPSGTSCIDQEYPMSVKTQSTSLFLSVSFKCIFYYSAGLSVYSISLTGNVLKKSAITSLKTAPNSSSPSLTASLALVKAVAGSPSLWNVSFPLQCNLFKIETLISISFTVSFSNSTCSLINGT